MPDFNAWFEENKESDSIRDGYNEYVFEVKSCGLVPVPIKTWARNYYENFVEVYDGGTLLP